ncbi:P-loop containing nucleoside triphosphate hydrolase protein [Gonapodya prolifera JEL478]|uniref:p-loop containing nucleoside triphosphate hydrolase protein n=1 Tax=Gonapodya prolifera (strain JEL478) TaxID=1344416 RepID=A0A139AYM6_GONPJ|nr:P-loop containing nucleoside triphosphate hydrolase protein [Gonapodya prolifera JEL478]|eukprot:KXS21829.1 P-loop containing nucleoside triphosphate hydrolase protein [Gonapodya prolifera JEL478]
MPPKKKTQTSKASAAANGSASPALSAVSGVSEDSVVTLDDKMNELSLQGNDDAESTTSAATAASKGKPAAKANGKAARASKTASKTSKKGGSAAPASAAAAAPAEGTSDDSGRTAAGVLTSHKDSRDIKIEQASLSFHSQVLLTDAELEFNFGRRYGLIGPNGCGKSTFLEAMASREFPIPVHIDTYLLKEEYPPTDFAALDAVVNDAKEEVRRLEAMMEEVMADDPESPILEDIFARIDMLDESTFEARASEILHGLGFTHETMKKKTRDLSGGWRMRVALARALFIKPTLLLLDQPTNHLDLGACVWLEEYLKRYDRILVVVSHSQDFMNNVCTNIARFLPSKKKLAYYSGNYDQYVKTREELETNQMKQFERQQAEIKHMKEFIASVGTYANLVRQAKSRQKILDKMEAAGLVEEVEQEKSFRFRFENVGKLPPPVLTFTNVSFAYTGKKEDDIYRNLDFGVDMDSRVALVGPNGAGKSTLLKIMSGELNPQGGQVSRHTSMKLVRYHQHAADQLDMDKSAVDYLRDKFVEHPRDISYWRQQIGKFGLTGNNQLCEIRKLSDGQRARIVFCELALSKPHIILFDEPTNALDIETIDSLAEAINDWDGGVVLVSHDFRLIGQVAEQIIVCENRKCTPWQGSILEYKEKLKKEVQADLHFA